MSAIFRAKSDLARALQGHPQAAALLQNLEVAVSVERNEARTLGRYEAAATPEVPENPEGVRQQLAVLKDAGCIVTLCIGSHGTGCTIADPDRASGINRGGWETIEQALDAAFQAWTAARPKVAA